MNFFMFVSFVTIQLERIKKGQVIDIWLEDASIEKNWGVFWAHIKSLCKRIYKIFIMKLRGKRQIILPEYLLNRVG